MIRWYVVLITTLSNELWVARAFVAHKQMDKGSDKIRPIAPLETLDTFAHMW